MIMLDEQKNEVPKSLASFLELMDRGGLVQPTTLAFAIGLKCLITFGAIQEESWIRKQFLTAKNQKLLFAGLVVRLLEQDILDEKFSGGINGHTLAVTNLTCNSASHCFAKSLCIRFFNTMTKSVVQTVNSQGLDKSDNTNRKVKKLMSSS